MGNTDINDFEDVTFERSLQHGVTIQAGTFPYLVRRCLHEFDAVGPVVDPCSFSSVFFLTYQWYIEPGELLSIFVDRYKLLYLSDKEKEKRKKLQICQAISYWINNFGNDFKSSQDVRMQLLEFQNDVQMDIGNNAAHLLDIEKWNVSRRTLKIKLDNTSQKTLCFDDIKANDIAEQITYLDWKGNSKIKFAEWRDYAKAGKTKICPNLKTQIVLFNNISRWVAAMILQKDTAEARARIFKKFLQICRHLQVLGNYNGLMAVVGGLSHSAIERMQKTKELLSNEDKLYIKEVLELLSSDGNYSNYRKETEKIECCQVQIPILGVIMKDVIALDTAVPDFIEQKGRQLCHFKKMCQLAQILCCINQLVKSKPLISPKLDLVNMLRVTLQPRFTEEELYEMSLAREPRCQTPTSCTLPRKGFKPVFAEWAAGVDATPDRETVKRYVEGMVEAVFKVYDTDKNGSINQAEFQSIATNFPFIDDFTMLDTNCDDTISREEMYNYFMNVNSHVMTRDFVHSFQEATIITPVLCVYCTGYLWGLGKAAFRCKDCNIVCHKDCKDHVVLECRQRNHFQTRDKPSKRKAMKKRMKFLEQSLGGSTESQIYNGSPVQLKKLFSVDNEEIQTLKEKLKQSDLEQSLLKEENSKLLMELETTKNELSKMKLQMSELQQYTLYFVLKKFEMLNMKIQTDV